MLGRQVEDSNDSLLEGMLVPFPAKRRHFSIPSVVAHDHIGTCSHIKKEGLQLLACLDRRVVNLLSGLFSTAAGFASVAACWALGVALDK
ncbi:MAG: hypothetical protein FRX49_06112 [Trebouxia sp. A1-2]|nr:MAG: hypothetical protein FRX49_06112 [Trebouxia sp. A1-2]